MAYVRDGDELVVSSIDRLARSLTDLRHHPVDEHLRAGGPAVIDTAHWASEFPWTSQARDSEADVIDLRFVEEQVEAGVIDYLALGDTHSTQQDQYASANALTPLYRKMRDMGFDPTASNADLEEKGHTRLGKA